MLRTENGHYWGLLAIDSGIMILYSTEYSILRRRDGPATRSQAQATHSLSILYGVHTQYEVLYIRGMKKILLEIAHILYGNTLGSTRT